jgi:hypothetical protein
VGDARANDIPMLARQIARREEERLMTIPG